MNVSYEGLRRLAGQTLQVIEGNEGSNSLAHHEAIYSLKMSDEANTFENHTRNSSLYEAVTRRYIAFLIIKKQAP